MASDAMTVASTPCSSPLFSGHLPEQQSRELVDSLLDNDEHQAVLDIMAIEAEKEDDLAEMVRGWGYTLSFPKPPISASKRVLRRKAGRPQVPDIDPSRISVRCVSEDYDTTHHKASWKANVEHETYRYIANNGIYRSAKFSSMGTDWITAKRSRHSERSTPAPELRHAQKNLKKDLDMHFKNREQPIPEPQTQLPPHPQSQPAPTNAPSSSNTQRPSASGSDFRPVNKERYKDPKLVKSASDLFVENFSSRMSALEKEMNAAANTAKGHDGHPKPGSSPRTAVTAVTSGQQRRHNDGSAPDTAKFLAQQAGDISKDVFTVKPVVRAEQPLKPLEKLTPQQKMVERRASESDKGSHRSSNPDSPALSTSFMTAMNAFAQIHHQYHKDGQNSKSSPSTVRSPSKHHPLHHHHHHHHHHHSNSGHISSNSSDTDSLNSVRKALTLTNNDIEKMRMGNTSTNPFSLRDYNRYLLNKAKVPTMSVPLNKTFGSQRTGVTGYRHPITSNPPQNQGGSTTLMSTGYNEKSLTPDPISDTSSMLINKGFRDSKVNSMSLPEISGKRLSVTSTTQRLL